MSRDIFAYAKTLRTQPPTPLQVAWHLGSLSRWITSTSNALTILLALWVKWLVEAQTVSGGVSSNTAIGVRLCHKLLPASID